MVVTIRNPVKAALFLVLSFFSAACIWMTLEAEFLSIALVLVYVGAVMVLFLFVVMMLDIDIESMREGFTRNLPVGALVAGIMWGSKSGVQFSLSLIALRALPVLILGGFTSVPGAIIGGLIIGVGEKVAEVYWGPLVNGAIENWFAYVLALVFLLFRPQGLFGEKIIERV